MKIDFDALATPPPKNEPRLSDLPAVLQVQGYGWLKQAVLWSAVSLSLGLSLSNQFDHAAEQQISALQAQVRSLEEGRLTQQQTLIHHERLLSSQYASMLESKFEHPDSSHDSHMVSQILQDQEKDFQKITQAMKNGMQDLANMLPGSRGWVHYYSEQLDDVERSSRKRNEALKDWAAQTR